jgi:hypothetical protein
MNASKASSVTFGMLCGTTGVIAGIFLILKGNESIYGVARKPDFSTSNWYVKMGRVQELPCIIYMKNNIEVMLIGVTL